MDDIDTEKNKIRADFFSFLYQFPFITECVLSYTFLRPQVRSINGVEYFDTLFSDMIPHKVYPFLIQTNIKESEYFNFIDELDKQEQLIIDKEKFSSDFVKRISGARYNRNEYELYYKGNQ